MNRKFSSIKIIVFTIVLCCFIVLFTSSMYAQATNDINEGTFKFKQWFSEKLNYSEFKGDNQYDFMWLDKDTLLYREYRNLRLVRDILSPNPDVINLTSFLMAKDEASTSNYLYVPDREVIVFAEEMPEPVIKMYNKRGEFVDYLLLNDIDKDTLKISYVKDKDAFLILAQSKLILCKTWNEYDVVAENVSQYEHKDNTSELIIFRQNGELYNISIMNLDDNRKTITKIAENVSYADYYPEDSLITFTATSQAGITSLYTVNYYEQYDAIFLKDSPKLRYEGLAKHTYDYGKQTQYLPAFDYVYSNGVFIVMGVSDGLDNSLHFIKDSDSFIEPLDNVFDFIFDDLTGNIVVIYNTETDGIKQIECRNIDNLNTSISINESVMLEKEGQLLYHQDISSISYFTATEGEEKTLTVHSLTETADLLNLNYIDYSKPYYINSLSQRYLLISYIDNDTKNNTTTYYSIDSKKKHDFANAYLGSPCSPVEIFVIEKSGNSLQLCIYLENTFSDEIEKSFRVSETANYHFNLGLKAGGMLTLLARTRETTSLGFEFSLFFSYVPLKFFFVEADITYARRNFSFDPEYAVGEDPLLVESIFIHSDILSFQIFADLSYPLNKDIKLYLLFGGRFNYFFNNVLERNMNTGGQSEESFNSEINQGNLDLSTGIGASFLNTNKLGLSVEFVAYFSVLTPFKDSYLTELYNQSVLPVELQINVNFIFFKF